MGVSIGDGALLFMIMFIIALSMGAPDNPDSGFICLQK